MPYSDSCVGKIIGNSALDRRVKNWLIKGMNTSVKTWTPKERNLKVYLDT